MEVGVLCYLRVVVAVTAVKMLLMPAYRSTDFEVHRNWMAVTHSLPLREWYVDTTSPWTLDYPPLFAWFEYLLSKLAYYFDPEMLVSHCSVPDWIKVVQNLDYASHETILFQRLSVIVSDLVLISAAWFAAARSDLSLKDKVFLFGLVIGNAGLLMVDHIHFQYNGFLIGILVWSVLAIECDRCVEAAVLFSILINMKHLFIFSAPVYFSYLLKHDCLKSGKRAVQNFCRLAASVLFVTGVAFGPFVYHGQIQQVRSQTKRKQMILKVQILSRLFPFGRGLCHAYWAPNAWALYAFVDKCLAFAVSLLSPNTHFVPANMTGGLVGQWQFSVLPDIPPVLASLLAFTFATLPAALLFQQPSSMLFMESVAYANLCGFVWGYHVHEKAILPVLLPLIFVAFRNGLSIYKSHRANFFFLSSVAHYSLTPLLHEPQEYPFKLILVLAYGAYVGYGLQHLESVREKPESLIDKIEKWTERVLLLALILLEFSQFLSVVFKLTIKYTFLPLMMTSLLCSLGISWYWTIWTIHFLASLFTRKSKTT